MSGRDFTIAGCGLLVGALLAFPAGMMVAGGGGGAPEERSKAGAPPSGQRPPGRDMYAPTILDDPYVREQQLRTVEALELSCRQRGEHCTEAKAARARISERD